jgi:hypothetical protein
LGAIEIQLVRRTADEPLFESLMEEFHYLRYEQGRSAPPGVAYPRPHGPADLAGLEVYLRAPRSICWRPSSIRNDSAGPVIGRRTGYCWGGPRGEAKTIRPIGRTGRSKKCWLSHCIAGFTSCYRTCK